MSKGAGDLNRAIADVARLDPALADRLQRAMLAAVRGFAEDLAVNAAADAALDAGAERLQRDIRSGVDSGVKLGMEEAAVEIALAVEVACERARGLAEIGEPWPMGRLH